MRTRCFKSISYRVWAPCRLCGGCILTCAADACHLGFLASDPPSASGQPCLRAQGRRPWRDPGRRTLALHVLTALGLPVGQGPAEGWHQA